MSWQSKALLDGKAVFFLMGIVFMIAPVSFGAGELKEVKGKHFIAYYNPAVDLSLVKQLLREAEGYYDKIAEEIGYARYRDYWTWEDRARIIIYADQEEFMQKTGLPSWSRGGTARDVELIKTRVIVTYPQQEDFLDGLLPHEISHLILRDFIGSGKEIPVWFDEGIAQLQEKKRGQQAWLIMKQLVEEQGHIPLEALTRIDIQSVTDPKQAALFYLQSVSIVDFLINKYGSRQFGELCQQLKEKNFEEALHSAYTAQIESMAELEEKWLKYLKFEL